MHNSKVIYKIFHPTRFFYPHQETLKKNEGAHERLLTKTELYLLDIKNIKLRDKDLDFTTIVPNIKLSLASVNMKGDIKLTITGRKYVIIVGLRTALTSANINNVEVRVKRLKEVIDTIVNDDIGATSI